MPIYTKCREEQGEVTQHIGEGRTRHRVMIETMGKCRVCGSTQLFEGSREKLVQRLADEVIALHIVKDDEVWEVDDFLYAEVYAMGQQELEVEDPTRTMDYMVESFRVLHSALSRARVMIEVELAAVGEDVE